MRPLGKAGKDLKTYSGGSVVFESFCSPWSGCAGTGCCFAPTTLCQGRCICMFHPWAPYPLTSSGCTRSKRGGSFAPHLLCPGSVPPHAPLDGKWPLLQIRSLQLAATVPSLPFPGSREEVVSHCSCSWFYSPLSSCHPAPTIANSPFSKLPSDMP